MRRPACETVPSSSTEGMNHALAVTHSFDASIVRAIDGIEGLRGWASWRLKRCTT